MCQECQCVVGYSYGINWVYEDGFGQGDGSMMMAVGTVTNTTSMEKQHVSCLVIRIHHFYIKMVDRGDLLCHKESEACC